MSTFLTNSSCRTDNSTSFLTLSIPAFIMLPILAVQGWGRAGVTAVVKDKMGRVKFKEPTDWLCAAPGVTCDHPHRYQEELVLFLYKRWVYFLVCQSCIQYFHGFWFFPKRISGSWWHRNFSFRYLPAHWIQSHGQIRTLCQKFHLEMACMGKIYTPKR